MKGYEITRELKGRRKEGQFFIKWWRKENDFLDFDLIDRFLLNFNADEEISDFELLRMEEMWDEVKKVSGPRISKIGGGNGGILIWQPPRSETKKQECPFTPESLITIFDVETRGNPVD